MDTVPALVEALTDKSANTRKMVAQFLGSIGPDAKAAVPALIEALEDENEQVREAAAEALKMIDPEAAKKAGGR